MEMGMQIKKRTGFTYHIFEEENNFKINGVTADGKTLPSGMLSSIGKPTLFGVQKKDEDRHFDLNIPGSPMTVFGEIEIYVQAGFLDDMIQKGIVSKDIAEVIKSFIKK